MAKLITETEVHSGKSNQEGITTMGTIEMRKRTPDSYLAEYAQKPHIETCLDVQISKISYQASQMALAVFLEKYANSA